MKLISKLAPTQMMQRLSWICLMDLALKLLLLLAVTLDNTHNAAHTLAATAKTAYELLLLR